MLEAQRRRTVKEKTKQTIKAIGETIGAIFTLLLIALLFWLFLVVTPDQFSAECEILREQMESKQ